MGNRHNPKHENMKAQVHQKKSKLEWTYGSVDFLFKALTGHGLLAVEEGPGSIPQFRKSFPSIRAQVEFLLTAMEAWGMIQTDPKTHLVTMVKPPTISMEDWVKRYPPQKDPERVADPDKTLIDQLIAKDEQKEAVK